MGDGTTSVVLLAGEILKHVKGFVEDGLHPQVSRQSETNRGLLFVLLCRQRCRLFVAAPFAALPLALPLRCFVATVFLFRRSLRLVKGSATWRGNSRAERVVVARYSYSLRRWQRDVT